MKVNVAYQLRTQLDTISTEYPNLKNAIDEVSLQLQSTIQGIREYRSVKVTSIDVVDSDDFAVSGSCDEFELTHPLVSELTSPYGNTVIKFPELDLLENLNKFILVVSISDDLNILRSEYYTMLRDIVEYCVYQLRSDSLSLSNKYDLANYISNTLQYTIARMLITITVRSDAVVDRIVGQITPGLNMAAMYLDDELGALDDSVYKLVSLKSAIQSLVVYNNYLQGLDREEDTRMLMNFMWGGE